MFSKNSQAKSAKLADRMVEIWWRDPCPQ